MLRLRELVADRDPARRFRAGTVDADDDRVRPYEADASLAGGGGAGGAGNGADDKASARLAQEERDRARRFNEQRKEEARSAFRAAAGS